MGSTPTDSTGVQVPVVEVKIFPARRGQYPLLQHLLIARYVMAESRTSAEDRLQVYDKKKAVAWIASLQKAFTAMGKASEALRDAGKAAASLESAPHAKRAEMGREMRRAVEAADVALRKAGEITYPALELAKQIRNGDTDMAARVSHRFVATTKS